MTRVGGGIHALLEAEFLYCGSSRRLEFLLSQVASMQNMPSGINKLLQDCFYMPDRRG